MRDAEKLLRKWRQQPPRDGVDCEDAILVMQHLGMTVTTDGQNHKLAFHRGLVGSAEFPYGSFRVNCHAFGIQGKAHPKAIKDILKAAEILEGEE